MKRVVLALALALSPLYASAQDVHIEQVITHHSIPNESYNEFVMRISRFINGWTKSSDAEMCGILTSKNNEYFVILSTTRSQLSCATRAIVSGTTPTGDTIHSHPHTMANGSIRITDKTRHVEGSRVPLINQMDMNGNMFSNGDYAAGNGFLVANDTVYYQNGKGTVRSIGKLPPAGD